MVSACVPVVRAGLHLEAQEATSGHEVGNAYSKQAGRVRSEESQGWVDPQHQVQQARLHSNPIGLSAMRTGEGWQQNLWLSPGF